jgi:hypothetical protein
LSVEGYRAVGASAKYTKAVEFDVDAFGEALLHDLTDE